MSDQISNERFLELQRIAIGKMLLPALQERLGRDPTPNELALEITEWFGRRFRDSHSPLNYFATGEELGSDPSLLPDDVQNAVLERHHKHFVPLPPGTKLVEDST